MSTIIDSQAPILTLAVTLGRRLRRPQELADFECLKMLSLTKPDVLSSSLVDTSERVALVRKACTHMYDFRLTKAVPSCEKGVKHSLCILKPEDLDETSLKTYLNCLLGCDYGMVEIYEKCKEMGNLALADKILNLKDMGNEIRLHLFNEKLKNYLPEEERMDRFVLRSINSLKTEDEDRLLYRSGPHIAQEILKVYEGWPADWPELLKDQVPSSALMSAMRLAAQEPQDRDLRAIAEKVQRGEIVMLPVGHKQHCSYLVFGKGYMAVCNRGLGNKFDKTIKCYKIDQSSVTERVLQDITEFYLARKGDDEAFDYYYSTLPVAISPIKDAAVKDILCKQMEKLSLKESRVGNCTYAALKAATRVFFAMERITTSPGGEATLLDEDIKKAKRASKVLSTNTRFLMLDQYLAKSKSPYDPLCLACLNKAYDHHDKIPEVPHIHFKHVQEFKDDLINPKAPIEEGPLAPFTWEEMDARIQEALNGRLLSPLEIEAIYGSKQLLVNEEASLDAIFDNPITAQCAARVFWYVEAAKVALKAGKPLPPRCIIPCATLDQLEALLFQTDYPLSWLNYCDIQNRVKMMKPQNTAERTKQAAVDRICSEKMTEIERAEARAKTS